MGLVKSVRCVRSQSYTMGDVGKELVRSSSPTPLLKQRQLEPVAQEYVQMALEYL